MDLWEEARIEERTVTIKVLRVGSKQMTQALFWQLPARAIIEEETGKLLGTVWGILKVTEARQHERKIISDWVLWEDQGALYRCSLDGLQSNHKKSGEARKKKIEQYTCDFVMAYILSFPDLTAPYAVREDPDGTRRERPKIENSWLGKLIGKHYTPIRLSDSLLVEEVYLSDDMQLLLTYQQRTAKLRAEMQPTREGSDLGGWLQRSNQEKQTTIDALTSEYKKARLTLTHWLLNTLKLEKLPENLIDLIDLTKQRTLDYHRAGQEIDESWKQSYQTLTESEQVFIGA